MSPKTAGALHNGLSEEFEVLVNCIRSAVAYTNVMYQNFIHQKCYPDKLRPKTLCAPTVVTHSHPSVPLIPAFVIFVKQANEREGESSVYAKAF